MAKQVGPLFFTGTVDGLIFYKLGDHYYMRSKGSYKSRKQMRRDPKYKRTMEKADQFGQASNLTKEVYYRYLPKAVRKHGLFSKLTGLVNGWLQQGKHKEEVLELLIAYCQTLVSTATVTPAAALTTANAAKAIPVITSTQQSSSNSKPRTTKVKQARYLSRWKVKPNGRLQVPKSAAVDCLPSGSSLVSSA
jgi:hypothetical protein